MNKIIATTVVLMASWSTFGQGIEGQWDGIIFNENIIVGIIFKLVFTVQIFGLSFFLPRFLMRKIIDGREISTISKPIVSRYTIMNNVVVITGLLVLALLWLHPTFSSIIPILIVIGVYFILQLSPLAFNKQLMVQPKVPAHLAQDSFSLSETIHPLVVGVAGFLFISYLTVYFLTWDGSLNTQLLQMVIFIGTNIYLTLMIAINIHKVKQSKDEEKLKQIGKLLKITPFFVYISIGISLYYYGKMLLFGFELYEYRPIMMSIAFLLLGLLIYSQISFNPLQKKNGNFVKRRF